MTWGRYRNALNDTQKARHRNDQEGHYNMNTIRWERFVTCSDSNVGRLVSPIESMSFSMSYVGLSVKTFFHKYELKSRLNMNSMGINS